MRMRRATEADLPQIAILAKKYSLDYPGMSAEDFFVAVERGKILGICALRQHESCEELCSLGVEEGHRGQGVGRSLVLAVSRQAKTDLYLATVIPEYFQKFGFERASNTPVSMIKSPDWCNGCPRERCAVLVRPKR